MAMTSKNSFEKGMKKMLVELYSAYCVNKKESDKV